MLTWYAEKIVLPVPVEIVIGTVGAFATIIPLWYTISSSKTNERAKDLQTGERGRIEYVIREVPQLEPKLSSAISAVRKLEKSPNPSLTGELKTNLEDLLDLVEEIDTIQDAQTRVISALRDTRDRGLVLLVALALLCASWIMGSTLFEGGFLGLALPGFLGLAAFYLLPIGGFWVYRRYGRYRKIINLLRERKLDVLGA